MLQGSDAVYSNLPFGGIALAAAVFLVKKSTPPAVSMGDKRNGWQRMLSIDWVGTVLVLGCVTALVFATTYGPNRGWNNGGVIAVRTFAEDGY